MANDDDDDDNDGNECEQKPKLPFTFMDKQHRIIDYTKHNQ